MSNSYNEFENARLIEEKPKPWWPWLSLSLILRIFLILLIISLLPALGYYAFLKVTVDPIIQEKIVYKTKKSIQWKTRYKTREIVRERAVESYSCRKAKEDLATARERIRRLIKRNDELEVHKYAIKKFYETGRKGTVEIYTD